MSDAICRSCGSSIKDVVFRTNFSKFWYFRITFFFAKFIVASNGFIYNGLFIFISFQLGIFFIYSSQGCEIFFSCEILNRDLEKFLSQKQND